VPAPAYSRRVTAAPARDRAQLVVFVCQSVLAIPGTSAGAGLAENIGGLFRLAGTASAGAWRACSCLQPVGSPGRWWSCDEARRALCPVGLSGVLSRGLSGVRPSGRGTCFQVLCWSACCTDSFLGRPCASAAGSPRARTYSGQRRHSYPHLMVFAQVRGIWRCRQESTVKPSAQPTLVRTQHLPPAKRPVRCGNAARRAVFFLSRRVSRRITVSRCVAVSTDV
jgi:hypothetical protein